MIPKSLHTVTALVNVARELCAVRADASLATPDARSAVRAAAVILGYGNICDPATLVADPHGLIERATLAFAKEHKVGSPSVTARPVYAMGAESRA